MVDDEVAAAPSDVDPVEKIREIGRSLSTADTDALRALPHLRLAAADALRRPDPPDRRAAYPDPFPDVHGRLPEIGPQEITAEVLGGGILHHGAVIVRGMLAPDDVRRLRDGMDRTFVARDEADDPDAGRPPWYLPFRTGKKTLGEKPKPHYIRLVDSPRMLEDVLSTYRRLGVLDAVESYFGEAAVFTSNKSVMRRLEAPDPIPTDYHQDGRFMGAEVVAANVWLTLTDCTGDAPSLDLVPRREPAIAPTGNSASGFDWTISADEVDALAADTPVIRLVLQAGDALLFDHYLIHRTGYSAGMTRVREAVECWLFAPSTVPWQYQALRA
jgi:hypothetical protein